MQKNTLGFPRVHLADLPTPFEGTPRFSRVLGGPQIFIKRDDATALALGGNKARKLEFLLGDALAKQCDTVITAGGPQSNHARMTAAASVKIGMQPVLVLDGDDPGTRPVSYTHLDVYKRQVHSSFALLIRPARSVSSIPGPWGVSTTAPKSLFRAVSYTHLGTHRRRKPAPSRST